MESQFTHNKIRAQGGKQLAHLPEWSQDSSKSPYHKIPLRGRLVHLVTSW